jgi:hypothetical protein
VMGGILAACAVLSVAGERESGPAS